VVIGKKGGGLETPPSLRKMMGTEVGAQHRVEIRKPDIDGSFVARFDRPQLKSGSCFAADESCHAQRMRRLRRAGIKIYEFSAGGLTGSRSRAPVVPRGSRSTPHARADIDYVFAQRRRPTRHLASRSGIQR